jgi:hypothetical protein
MGWFSNRKEIERIDRILAEDDRRRAELAKPVQTTTNDLDIAIRKLEVDLRKYAIQNVIRIGQLNLHFDFRRIAEKAIKDPEGVGLFLNSLAKDLRKLGLDGDED